MAEETPAQKTLWMLDCETGYSRKLIPIYAFSEADAHEQAEKHIRESDQPLTFIGLRAMPDGFTIYHSRLPGKA
ncbi:MAG: hypothetical protein ACRDIV_03645 [Ktedonobacteraceae bacterium]